ncbi:MAG: hypothetical protein OXC46_08420, partial [Thaumarchaeota archaeon]|nr:hypothetical protein [Nitrososphaerota archaeon]
MSQEFVDIFKAGDEVLTMHGEGRIVGMSLQYADVNIGDEVIKCDMRNIIKKSDALLINGKVTSWDRLEKSDRLELAMKSGINVPNTSAYWDEIPERHQELIKSNVRKDATNPSRESHGMPGSMGTIGQRGRTRASNSNARANVSARREYDKGQLSHATLPKGDKGRNHNVMPRYLDDGSAFKHVVIKDSIDGEGAKWSLPKNNAGYENRKRVM